MSSSCRSADEATYVPFLITRCLAASNWRGTMYVPRIPAWLMPLYGGPSRACEKICSHGGLKPAPASRLRGPPPISLAQLPHFGGVDGGKAADFRDPSRLRSNCGAKNCCASEGLSVLTGSAAVCWHSELTRAFRSPGC